MAWRYTIARNVLSEYDEWVVEQRGIGIIEIQPLRERLTIKVLAKKKDTTKTKPNKIKMLDFVYLSEQEYANLITSYGIKPVKDIIQRLNDYIGSKWDKYKNHYYAINTRFNKAWTKKICTQKELPPTPEVKPQREYVPMTLEEREVAKAKLLAFRQKLWQS